MEGKIISKFEIARVVFEIARVVLEKEELLISISDKGKKSLSNAIYRSFPTENIVICNKVDCFKTAQHIVREIHKVLICLSYKGLQDFYEFINSFLIEQLNDIKKEVTK